MGRHWYEDGKLFNKMNTFNDFIDCGKAMVEAGFTSPTTCTPWAEAPAAC